MEGIFQEFENENALRSYPFSSGCDLSEEDGRIPEGLFVDACLYPFNPSGVLYVSGLSETGVFSISDDSGVVMSGSPSGGVVELYDMSTFRRHAGTLIASSSDALQEFAGRGASISFARENASFSSSCVFPVVVDGVTSLAVGDADARDGLVSFANDDDDDVRVACSPSRDGEVDMRFDVLPRPGSKDPDSIRRIICVVDGETPFRISKLAYNIVLLTLDGICREDVCAHAHREDGLQMSDTCACSESVPMRQQNYPEAYQLEEVFIPPDEVPEGAEYGPEGGTSSGAANAFFLVVPNLTGYSNPLSLTLEDGDVAPMIDGPETVVDGNSADLAEGALADDVTSKSVVIQVPGLAGGSL